jgi:adenylate cyclase
MLGQALRRFAVRIAPSSPGEGRSGRGGRRPAAGGPLRRAARQVGWGRTLALLLLPVLLAIRVLDPAPLETLRLRIFDAFQVLNPREAPADRPVAILDIDEASLRELGQWPWPRTRLAELVRRTTEAGAAVIAFDVVFAEPDRLSPPRLADSIPGLGPAARAELRAQPASDEAFAAAIGAGRVVLGQTAAAQPVPWPGGGDPPRTGIAVVGIGPDPAGRLVAFPGLVRNVPVLEGTSAGRGVFTIFAERDGIVRRVPMVMRAGDTMVPGLALEVARVLTGAESVLVQTGAVGVVGVRLADIHLPTDPDGRVFVRFRPHDASIYVSARDLLAGDVPPERLRDRIVLVGTSAIGLLDNRTTPLDRTMPGVEVHAQLLETMLAGGTLLRPSDAILGELAAALAIGLVIVVVAPILGAFGGLLLGGLVTAALVAFSWLRFTRDGVLFDATFPFAASLALLFLIVFTNYVREQRGRSRIRAAFGHYLSPDLVEQLAQSPEKLRLGGEERRLTIMFSDVRGFTKIAEFYKADPAGLTHLMNRFLTPLTDAILARRGTIDKYMGDAIMAFWNAPLDDSNQERNAAAAALDMLVRMEALNAARKAEAESGGYPVLPLDIGIGIGINTGACVVGNMGSELRFDYSVLGDPVNVASRLEGQSKFYGVRIILGSATAAALRDTYPLLELDRIRVKGKSEPETVWTLLGGPHLRDTDRFRNLASRHAAMLEAYRTRRWREVEAEAGTCLALAEGLAIDGLYVLYTQRAAAFAATPPPDVWDWVYVAMAK